MRIKPESIEKVKNTLDIVEVISDFVSLKKKGKDFWGLSPFANEKTPSFSVSQVKGFFKDFSSGKAGDAVTFVMEHESMMNVQRSDGIEDFGKSRHDDSPK